MLLPITFGIVTQLSDIKRQKARLEQLKREAEEEKERAREAARERVLQEFEKGQLGLAASTSVATTSGTDSELVLRDSKLDVAEHERLVELHRLLVVFCCLREVARNELHCLWFNIT